MENLTILTKWEDMAEYSYSALKNYPKSEKHTLAARTVTALIDMGVAFQQAGLTGNRSEKRIFLKEADNDLAHFKLLIRFGVRLGYLPLRKMEVLSGYIVEIGKMLGGWLKSIEQ